MLRSFETIMTMALELVFIHLVCSLILLCNENRTDQITPRAFAMSGCDRNGPIVLLDTKLTQTIFH
ncbi:hypothetical protein HanIR_Chr07g0308791 [Helianthus annuus]|nr:hypothetical protein HanIR_Chr07g0308791 [Helianthus annuus]